MDTETLLTMEDAAAQIGVSLSAIRNATQEGRLPFVRAFGRKLIEREALAAYRARTQVDGVPPRGRSARRPAKALTLPSPKGLGEGKEGYSRPV